jgi:hypothetical protein
MAYHGIPQFWRDVLPKYSELKAKAVPLHAMEELGGEEV